MTDLSLQKNARRIRIYIGDSDRWRGKPLDIALLETLRAQELAGATVFRGAAGYGAHSRIHTSAIEVLSVDLPVVIEAIDTAEKISAALEIVGPMVQEGLITLEDVEVVKYTHRFQNPLPADRLVSEAMTGEVVTVPPSAPIHQVWKQMLHRRVKAVPVIDADMRVVGIITDEDLLERAGIQQRLSVAIRLDAAEISQEMSALEQSPLTAADVMTHPVITAQADEALAAVTTRMIKAGLKRLPVIGENDQLVGILSRLDILRQVTQSPRVNINKPVHPQAVRTVQDIMTGEIPMVNQDENLAGIIAKFAQTSSHRLIVINEAGSAVGLISDSDVVARVQPPARHTILQALRQLGKTPSGKETAGELMSPGPLTAPPSLPIAEAVQRMLAQSRKWLIVVDEHQKPLGLVDRQRLLEAVTGMVK